MAKIGQASPNLSFNSSLGLSMTSPNIMNISDQMKRLLPPKSRSCHRYSFSPLPNRFDKSPNVSPITKVQDSTPSPTFIKRRNLGDRLSEMTKMTNDGIHQQKSPSERISLTPNFNLEKRLSVRTVLKDLNLSNLNSLFEDEEIDLKVFLTLNDEDLKSVGVELHEDRKKILDFIESMKTPEKNSNIKAPLPDNIKKRRSIRH